MCNHSQTPSFINLQSTEILIVYTIGNKAIYIIMKKYIINNALTNYFVNLKMFPNLAPFSVSLDYLSFFRNANHWSLPCKFFEKKNKFAT